jgi:Sec-independent protein translocase protein TatA
MGDLFAILVIVLVIVLIVRGPKTIPQLGAMFGRGVRDARDELKGRDGGAGGDPAA